MNIINTIAEKILLKKSTIEDFFYNQFLQNPAIFYNSIDLRHSGYKICAVDTNCYPAGFNNLSATDKKTAKKLVDEFIAQKFLDKEKNNSPKNIFIIPENHTRNMRYLDNLGNICEILQSTEINHKRQIYIATFNSEITEKTIITLDNQQSLTLFPLKRIGDKLVINDENNADITADLAILNNDLTNGIPEILTDITTPIHPSLNMGWFQRTKSNHFKIYEKIATQIAHILELDPWLISSLHANCDDVNFKENIGIECLAKNVDELLKKIAEKYRQHDIKDTPYCYIKADNGTYGMAVWAVHRPEDVLEINKKERNKMNMLKGSTQTSKVMIQEGIITHDKINEAPCEPMIYMINSRVASYLFRANQERDPQISLNASGAQFFNLENIPLNNNFIDNKNNFLITYELVARIASLSSAIENQQINN